MTTALVVAMLVGAIVMAFRNVRLNRGDRRTASRLGGYIFLVNVASWLFSASHVPDFTRELGLMMGAFGPSLFFSGSTYVIYLALEPYVRRRSPQRLISWTRLCAGKFDDPLVGRDVLIGMAAGGLLLALILWGNIVPEWIGEPPVRPLDITMELLMGPRWAVSSLFGGQSGALFNGLFFVFMPLLLQVVFRKPVIAQAAFFLLLLGLFTFRETHPEVAWISNALQLVRYLRTVLARRVARHHGRLLRAVHAPGGAADPRSLGLVCPIDDRDPGRLVRDCPLCLPRGARWAPGLLGAPPRVSR